MYRVCTECVPSVYVVCTSVYGVCTESVRSGYASVYGSEHTSKGAALGAWRGTVRGGWRCREKGVVQGAQFIVFWVVRCIASVRG